MIFLSHTHADKPIVDNMANTLRTVFGEEKIFYDSWSIQPGDGIIDKINSGLASCQYFFFFVSNKSLQSNMVKLEWQNALYKSTKEKTMFIPVRVDDCLMPEVLLHTLYIDIFNQGIETAIKQMIDVINNQVNYTPLEGFQNIRAYIKQESSKLTVEFRAEVYMEPHSKFVLLVDNLREELSFQAIGESMFDSGFHENVKLDNDKSTNIIILGRQTATSPHFPFIVEINANNQATIKLQGVCRFVSRDRFEAIPIIYL